MNTPSASPADQTHMAESVGSATLKNYEDPDLADMLDLVESLSEDQQSSF